MYFSLYLLQRFCLYTCVCDGDILQVGRRLTDFRTDKRTIREHSSFLLLSLLSLSLSHKRCRHCQWDVCLSDSEQHSRRTSACRTSSLISFSLSLCRTYFSVSVWSVSTACDSRQEQRRNPIPIGYSSYILSLSLSRHLCVYA